MTDQNGLKALCYKDGGALKTKAECRAAMINQLILEDLVDFDEAEDLVEKTIRELDLWPVPVEEPKKEEPLP